jgi:lipopolysaccharide/colanic/teichoic acid biosynthesis glycosyltransferase
LIFPLFDRILKRGFDLVCAVAGLILLSPLLLVIALAIKREDGGPIFYRGTRIGRNGRPFRIFKFRTMVVDAERVGGPSSPDGDPRITRPGRLLRRYKLDEIPELINVLVGEMSIVGPRPEVAQYIALFNDEEREILGLRPGITDWATLWNSDEGALLAGSDDPEKFYLEKIRPTKVQLQLAYLRKHTFLVDLSIVAQTLLSILLRRKPAALGVLKG